MLMPSASYPPKLLNLNESSNSQDINNSSFNNNNLQIIPKKQSSSIIQTQMSHHNLIIPSFINSFVEKPPFNNSLYFWPQEFNYNCGKTEMAKIFGFFENNEIKYNQQLQEEENLVRQKISSLNEKNSLKSTENNLIQINQSNKNIKQLKRINNERERRNNNNNNRRYKTPSPQLLRLRREAANARERRRMNHLNKAFEKLRNVLPSNIEEGRRLSKFETLLCAQEYITILSKSLGEEEKEEDIFNKKKQRKSYKK